MTDGAPDSYEDAVERLEEIIDRLDSGQAGLRETLDLCKEGRNLVDYCAGELDAVGEGLKELNLDDLAAPWDRSSGRARRGSATARRSTRPPSGRWRGGETRCAKRRSPCAPTTLSAPWSAATPWPRPRMVSPSPARRPWPPRSL